MNEYQAQAEKFLSDTGTTLEIKFLKHDKYFDDDYKRDIYQCTLIRNSRKYSFTFGQSLNNSGLKLISPTGKTLCVMPTEEYLKIKNSKFSPL